MRGSAGRDGRSGSGGRVVTAGAVCDRPCASIIAVTAAEVDDRFGEVRTRAAEALQCGHGTADGAVPMGWALSKRPWERHR